MWGGWPVRDTEKVVLTARSDTMQHLLLDGLPAFCEHLPDHSLQILLNFITSRNRMLIIHPNQFILSQDNFVKKQTKKKTQNKQTTPLIYSEP